MRHDHHHHDHHHDHHDPVRHRSLWLDPRARRVHRVGRRQFLTDLGRGVFGLAVVGGVVAACSSDDDPTNETAAPPDESGDAAVAAPPTAAPQTGGGASGGDESLRWAQASLGFVSAYVLVRGNEAAVVDTGSSGSEEEIGSALATLGATYDDVRHVVLTHSHGDHIGSLPAVLERAPSAMAYAGTLDIPNIDAPREIVGVGDGDDVFGLQVIDTPGHTPGSISVLDTGIGLLVAGDALNGNDDGTGLSGVNPRFTANVETADESIAKLAALGVDIQSIAVGHGQPVESGAGQLLQSLSASL